ncbi:MAG: pyridoxine 5'-phosphate synthase [Planctomycetes bacterium]|nr:pyridoxine 5'-phosphate synthase [Planctomycetota bacterium]MCB9934877.1 pyridoxine 5'-phosphate synthase [Planctomycetota bacterium]
MTLLGVNVDHVATLRNARGTGEPEPLQAALSARLGGADGIVCHLREDRRHINERDVRLLLETVHAGLQLELALADDIVKFALEVKPAEVMIVPERRQELTTEGGFDAIGGQAKLAAAIAAFREAGITVSVFVAPEMAQLEAAQKAGAETVELHTGPFSHARTAAEQDVELDKIETAAHRAWELGLEVHAGHGLNYGNIERLLKTVPVERVNIGHAIVSRALFTGFENAVRDMKALIAASS